MSPRRSGWAWLLGFVVISLFATPALTGSPCIAGRTAGKTVEIGRRTFLAVGTTILEVSGSTDVCLGCHDGAVGTRVLNPVGPAKLFDATFDQGWSGQLETSHPVDIDYPDGDSGFTPQALLDHRLELEDGRITCVTCHTRSGQGSSLSIEVDRSRLCLACHRR